jgi:hypothetical protein
MIFCSKKLKVCGNMVLEINYFTDCTFSYSHCMYINTHPQTTWEHAFHSETVLSVSATYLQKTMHQVLPKCCICVGPFMNLYCVYVSAI